MNRKNTILIAVLINAGLLAVLLIASLTTQEEIEPAAPVVAEAPLSLPKFDDQPMFNQEIPLATLPPEPKVDPIPLVLPEPLVHKLPPLVAEPAPVSESVPASPPLSSPAVAEVKVKKGDSLEKIAKAHRTTVDEIIKINHLPSTFLKIGQVLKIPTEKSLIAKVQEKKPVEQGPEYYIMKVGENPWAIAVKHRMKVEELLRLNALNEEKARKLKPGDRLRIR